MMTEALPNIPAMKKRHLKTINTISTFDDVVECSKVVQFDIVLAYRKSISKS